MRSDGATPGRPDAPALMGTGGFCPVPNKPGALSASARRRVLCPDRVTRQVDHGLRRGTGLPLRRPSHIGQGGPVWRQQRPQADLLRTPLPPAPRAMGHSALIARGLGVVEGRHPLVRSPRAPRIPSLCAHRAGTSRPRLRAAPGITPPQTWSPHPQASRRRTDPLCGGPRR